MGSRWRAAPEPDGRDRRSEIGSGPAARVFHPRSAAVRSPKRAQAEAAVPAANLPDREISRRFGNVTVDITRSGNFIDFTRNGGDIFPEREI
jgi:hypothetical protein